MSGGEGEGVDVSPNPNKATDWPSTANNKKEKVSAYKEKRQCNAEKLKILI